MNKLNNTEELSEIESTSFIRELFDFWDMWEWIIKQGFYKNWKMSPKLLSLIKKTGWEVKQTNPSLRDLQKNTPTVNGYLMEWMRLFSYNTYRNNKVEEWDTSYFSILYTMFTHWWNTEEEHFNQLVESFNKYGVRQKVWLGEFIAAINVFSYVFPRDVLNLDSIIDSSIKAYIRINKYSQAQKFYDNAEMMAFTEHAMWSGKVEDMFGMMNSVSSLAMSLLRQESSKNMWIEWKEMMTNQLNKISQLMKWQYENVRKHAKMAIKYIDSISTMSGFSDDWIPKDDWKATGDLYLDYTDRKSRSFPWVTIDMKTELGWKNKSILHLRTIEETGSYYIALGNIIAVRAKSKWRKHLQNKLLTDEFFPTYIFDEEIDSEQIDYKGVYYGIPFWVTKSGEIEVYGWDIEYQDYWITDEQASKMRAYILWYLAQLTNADYEIVSPRALTQDIKKPKSGKSPQILQQMPWIRPIVKNPDIIPPKEQREIDYRSPHTRLLPAWWTPSATQYIQWQESNMALFAYVQNNNEWTIDEICRIDIDSEDYKYSYEQFLELCNTIRKQYEKEWLRVRIQTYVKKFDRSVIRETRKLVPQIMWTNPTVPNIK